VTELVADASSDLLQDAGLHGHKYAIDAGLPSSLYTSRDASRSSRTTCASSAATASWSCNSDRAIGQFGPRYGFSYVDLIGV
jgi:hypothetical protein